MFWNCFHDWFDCSFSPQQTWHYLCSWETPATIIFHFRQTWRQSDDNSFTVASNWTIPILLIFIQASYFARKWYKLINIKFSIDLLFHVRLMPGRRCFGIVFTIDLTVRFPHHSHGISNMWYSTVSATPGGKLRRAFPLLLVTEVFPFA